MRGRGRLAVEPWFNDSDPAGDVRRAWAYFYEHHFQATVCH
ncbi:hypothetical protein NVS55_26790 [Myxococcus stipitatus]